MGGDEGDGDVEELQAQGPRRGEDAVRGRLRRAAQAAAGREGRRRPLRHRLVAARRPVEGRADRDARREGRREGRGAPRDLRGRARLHRERAAQGSDRRQRAHHLPPERQAVRARSTARRCAACPRPLLLEEREVDHRHPSS